MTFTEFVEQNIDLVDNDDFQELFHQAGLRGFGLRLRELFDDLDIDYIHKWTYIPTHAYSYSLIKYINIPKNITAIAEYAFMQCQVEMVQAAYSSVTHIRQKAFAYCDTLEEIWLPKTLKYIGALAFKGCNRLKKIVYEGTLDNWVTNVIKDANWKDDHVQILVQCLDGEIYV